MPSHVRAPIPATAPSLPAFRRLPRRLRFWVLLLAGLATVAPAARAQIAPPRPNAPPVTALPAPPTPAGQARPAAPPPESLNLQVTVFSTPAGPDRIAVTYDGDPGNAGMQPDFDALAQALGSAPSTLKITRREGATAAEAKLSGLANWTTGAVNLDALIRTFRRFGHFQVLYFFGGNFPLQPQSAESVSRPPVRVQAQVNGSIVAYEVWVDQSRGVPDPARLSTVPAGGDSGWIRWAAVLACVVVVSGGVFLIVTALLARRRAETAREGEL
jgi:hypothetical protein